jgi:hypothetical protein
LNIEETKKAIEVMQAFVDGKAIQCYSGFGWEPIKEPFWRWGSVNYRIKPEPKEIWVNEYSDGSNYGYDCRDNAIAAARDDAARKAVRYREVIEE